MDASVIVTFACAVLAAAGTGVLVGRCIRVPRTDLVAWACAVAAIAVALGAQALGAHDGYSSATFRVVQVGAQLIAPLWLVWGMVELTGRGVAARFGAKLVVAALTVVGAVVLITDPLGTTPFGKSWPIGSDHYQIIPRSMLTLIAGVTVLTVVVTLIVALVRLRSDPAWRRPLIAVAAAGAAAVAILGLRLNLSANLAYPALCAVCAGLATYAGLIAVKVRLDALHGGSDELPDETYDEADDEADGPAGRGARTALGAGAAAVRPEEFAEDEAFGAAAYPRRLENGASQRFGEDDWYRLDRRNQANGGYPPAAGYGQDGGYAMNGAENGDGDHRRGDGYPPAPGDEASSLPDADRTGVWQPRTLGRNGGLGAATGFGAGLGLGAGMGRGGAEPAPAGLEPNGVDQGATQRLIGLIAIYTLAEGRDAEFDALAERVVEEVRSSEPDALVYAVHSVPNAPMQRIFYEVYRDQTAYEEHKRHSYIQRFDIERDPYVLATNVIELGTQQAKLSPLPGLTQLFGRGPGE
jgi:quinol monooxygenase YgiN